MKKIKSVLLPGEFFKTSFLEKIEKLKSIEVDTLYLFDHGKNPAGNDLDVYKLIDGIYKLYDVINDQISLGVCVLNINARPFQELFEEYIYKFLEIKNFKLGIGTGDDKFEKRSKVIYQREKTRNLSSSTGIKLRPFLASREEFFKGSLLIENNTEYIIKDNFLFHANLKYSLIDNMDDLTIPPLDTYPAQVRSDVKEYLRNIDEGILIGRAQFDFYKTLARNHHMMLSGGILEDMFYGYGFEYLYFLEDSNYSFGFEIFNVTKRDYDWGFGKLDYKNITGHANFHYRNYGLVPFDMKLSYGEYLAGDIGTTIEFSRTYKNGMQFGIFASNTDVSAEQFGEGSFDKGIFFKIPIYGNLFNYSWRPLTKDPASKLNRRHTLNDLLVRFKPIN